MRLRWTYVAGRGRCQGHIFNASLAENGVLVPKQKPIAVFEEPLLTEQGHEPNPR